MRELSKKCRRSMGRTLPHYVVSECQSLPRRTVSVDRDDRMSARRSSRQLKECVRRLVFPYLSGPLGSRCHPSVRDCTTIGTTGYGKSIDEKMSAPIVP